MLKRWLTVNKSKKEKHHVSKKEPLSEESSMQQSLEPLRAIVSLETTENGGESSIDGNALNGNGAEIDYLMQSSPPTSDVDVFDTTMERPEHIDSDEHENVFDVTTVDSENDKEELHESILKISDIDNTALMPFGSGSNKIFGYENFGNTCYCNSVLQCLYNIPEFRTNILKYPLRPANQPIWERKLEMVGHTPKVFNESSFAKAVSHKMSINADTDNNTNENDTSNVESNGKQNKEKDQDDPRSPSTSRKLLSGFLKYSSKSLDQDTPKLTKQFSSESEERTPETETSNSQQQLSHSIVQRQLSGESTEVPNVPKPVVFPPRYKRIIVGRSLPEKAMNANNTLNNNNILTNEIDGKLSSDDSLHKYNEKSVALSNEDRKKSALINGPILNVDYSMISASKPNLYTALKDLFESITENESLTGVVSPTRFIHILKRENVLFNTMMHQDAHEFLNFLLNDLGEYADNHREEFEIVNNNENFIKNLFKGTQSSKIKCLTCDSVTTKNEPFLDFPIEVKENEATDVQKVLYRFHQRELLNSSNKFYCNVCCGLQEAERIVGIKSLPKILALHLKRFKYSETQNTNIKLFNKIEYPLILEVQSTFDRNVKKSYELTGVVMHMGGGPQHGHYVSLCKTEKFGWLFFDDETVETVEESTVLRFTGDSNSLTTAYVLFYKEIEKDETEFKLFHQDPVAKKEYQENIDALLKYDSIERAKKVEQINEANEGEDGDELGETNNTSMMTSNGGNDTVISSKSRKSRLFSFMKS